MMTFTLRPRADGKAYTLTGDNWEVLPHSLWFVELENAIAYAKWCAKDRDGALTLLDTAGGAIETTTWKAASACASRFPLAALARGLRALLAIFSLRSAPAA